MDDNKNPFVDNESQVETEEKQEETKDSEETQQEVEEVQNNELQEKYDELNNKYIRLAADFDNYRKRTLQEKEEISTYTQIEMIKKLTTVLDTFDRAKEHLKEIDNCATVKESYEVAYKQLLDVLKKMGLTEIEALGADFNPNEHEAITQVPTDEFEVDKVALVAQKGYKLNDRVVRPALVGVAKEKSE